MMKRIVTLLLLSANLTAPCQARLVINGGVISISNGAAYSRQPLQYRHRPNLNGLSAPLKKELSALEQKNTPIIKMPWKNN